MKPGAPLVNQGGAAVFRGTVNLFFWRKKTPPPPPPKPVKYAVYPGLVKSINDGDLHFISYQQLIRLYEVNPMDCINMLGAGSRGRRIEPMERHYRIVTLYPDPTGRYTRSDA